MLGSARRLDGTGQAFARQRRSCLQANGCTGAKYTDQAPTPPGLGEAGTDSALDEARGQARARAATADTGRAVTSEEPTAVSQQRPSGTATRSFCREIRKVLTAIAPAAPGPPTAADVCMGAPPSPLASSHSERSNHSQFGTFQGSLARFAALGNRPFGLV